MINKTIILIVAIVVIILAATSYLIIKSQEDFLLTLIKQDAIEYSDTIRRSVRHHMLENKRNDVKWIIETIGAEKQVSEIRIFNKEGRITVSSIAEKAGILVDMNSEGCISCHENGKLPGKQTEATRIYSTNTGNRFIGVMQAIYNEPACFKCHPESKKILGVLDIVLSLSEIDKEIYKNKRIMLLFFIITIFAISFIVAKSTYDLQVVNKRLEESNKKLQEIDKLKSEFVRKVSHQLRAPVSAIQSCIRVVIDGYVSGEKQNEMLERAERRIDSLIVMINDLLDLAKIEELKTARQKERVGLDGLLTRIVDFMKEKASTKKIALNLKLENILPPILASYDEIEGSLLNIIDNAIKYTPKGGTVEVIAKVDDDIKIEIKDSGMGIPENELLYIFDEFYRAENARVEDKEGTGLGLTIAKKTVELYGGRIEVESEIGKGTKFTVSFPI